jgi:hypothetical protein
MKQSFGIFACVLVALAVSAAVDPVATPRVKQLHWAFVPPARPKPPAVKETNWVRNPIDNFVLAKLKSVNASPELAASTGARQANAQRSQATLRPSPEADRITLIRRLSLDLTGLPPSIAEVDAFLNDTRPDAYERVVERLLASPHYGEKWGRHWLDLARYADSNGYSIDAPRSIWKYRDWVIAALNRDMPFDRFVIWQIAGDLIDTNHLPSDTAVLEARIATGFHRNTQINQEGGIDPEQFRVESVIDRVNTTATAFLGLTVGCAQCHDHKFDPITQREYYQVFAFFNNTVEDGHGKSAPEGILEIPGEYEPKENLHKDLEEAETELERYLNTKGSEIIKWKESLSREDFEKLKPEVQSALNIVFAEQTRKQKRAVYRAFRGDDPEFKPRDSKLTKLENQQTKPVSTLVMVERNEPRETSILIKGDFTRPSERVTAGVPASLHPLRVIPEGRLPNRLDLAQWLVDTNNPLTSRVIVNRVWQQYFGKGIVETENDFGTQGAPPSHPELLDWLACEFVAPASPVKWLNRLNELNGEKPAAMPTNHPFNSSTNPWSLKHLHRLIVTSATYRQASRVRPELAALDPNNKLFARQNRLRLDAEIVRDVGLTTSGLLNDRIGGPSVFPPQPDGVMNLGQLRREWKPSTGPDRYRRGMYTFFWRATPHPTLMVFDSGDGFGTCTRRLRSNTPLQALTLLNDEAFHEFAEALAARIMKEGGTTDTARIEYAFRVCVARPPAADEQQRLLKLLKKELALADTSTAWTSVSRVLLNLDETITRE